MGGVKRPARCFIYTDDESLTAAVAEGTVTEHDAQILRGFAALLRVTAAMRARTTRPNGEPMTTYNDLDAAERITEALTSGPLADESSSRAARSGKTYTSEQVADLIQGRYPEGDSHGRQ